MRNRIILHCVPPAAVIIPSAALTTLKTYLMQNGYVVDIIYWNLIFEDLQQEFIFYKKNLNETSIVASELLFLNYFAFYKNDTTLYRKVKIMLSTLYPQKQHGEIDFYDKHMQIYWEKTKSIIQKTLNNCTLSDSLYSGFSIKLDQWLVASIIGDQIKQLYPEQSIIVGGINTKESAISILKNFPQFDVSIWGEGEIKLLDVTKEIEKGDNCNFHNVNNITFRTNNHVIVSSSKKQAYVDLSKDMGYWDFSDYFLQAKPSTRVKTMVPVEISRGCHWNRCHFCYLNVGYKYRLKPVETLKNELLYYISTYKAYLYTFLDSDFIGEDIDRFNRLLDCLIEVRTIEPKFKIASVEIITKGLDDQLIKKMAEAGILSAQIGWESASNELLRKIDKKNTLASNLFFIKYAVINNIRVSYLNVIANLIEETDDDIFEGIDNIRFMRFFRVDPNIKQKPSRLTINASSKYCRIDKKIDTKQYVPYNLLHCFMEDYVNKDCSWNLFDFWLPYRNRLWDLFDAREQHYQSNKYSYQLIQKESIILFTEYLNYKEIDCFEINSLDYLVLSATNKKPISLSELDRYIAKMSPEKLISDNDIINRLQFYYKKGLIYHSNDFKEIISVINSDKITSN